jgi:hypothetical protein
LLKEKVEKFRKKLANNEEEKLNELINSDELNSFVKPENV